MFFIQKRYRTPSRRSELGPAAPPRRRPLWSPYQPGTGHSSPAAALQTLKPGCALYDVQNAIGQAPADVNFKRYTFSWIAGKALFFR